MIKMSRKAKKAMAVALTAGMLASTAATPVMAANAGWKQNATGWWYENADGTYPANKWQSIGGKWYYFDANGYMVSGWKSINGKWYYFGGANDGAMKDGWFKDATGQYSYAEPGDGAIYQAKWQAFEGEWYYLNSNGYMHQGGWAPIGGKWYFFNNNGVMQTGLIQAEDKTGTESIYYLTADGDMVTGEKEINGVTYTFDASGACTSETKPAVTKAFKNDGTPVEVKVEERELSVTSTTAITKDENGNFVLTALLSTEATATALKDTTLTLTNGSIVVTAEFVSVNGGTAVYKITNPSKLTPGDSSADGAYVVTGNGIDVATDTTATYGETIVGSAIQGIVYYAVYEGDVFKEYKPISGATVKVDNKTVTTDANGYYSISAAAGLKTVEVTATGFFGQTAEKVVVDRNYLSAQNVCLEEYDQDELYITGTVNSTDTSAKAVENAKVELQVKKDGKYETIATVTTGTDGKFVFENEESTQTIIATGDALKTFEKDDANKLSEKNEYQVVISKDYNAKDGSIYSNITDAYHSSTVSVSMSQTGAKTDLEICKLTPVKKINDIDLSLSWNEEATIPRTATIKVSLIDQNGKDTLASVSIIDKLAVKDGALAEKIDLVNKLFNDKSPTLESGKYALLVEETTDKNTSARRVIVIDVKEGEAISASGEFQLATDATIETTVKQATYGAAVKKAYKTTTANAPLDAFVITKADGSTVSKTENVKVEYEVYEKADGINVLVDTLPSNFKYTNNDTEGFVVKTTTNVTKIEVGKDYICVPTGSNVKSAEDVAIKVESKDVEKAPEKATVESAAKVVTLDIKKADFRNEKGEKVPAPADVKLLSVKIKDSEGNVVAEANEIESDDAAKILNAKYNAISIAAVFKDEADLTGITPGKYTAEIKLDGYKPITTEEFDLIDFHSATITTTAKAEKIAQTSLAGSFRYKDGSVVEEDASIVVYDKNGVVVAAQKYDGNAKTGNYEIIDGNSAKLSAGTYKVVVRGEGFETVVLETQLSANEENPLNIEVTKHDGGFAKLAVRDSNNYGFGKSNYNKITLRDENYVVPGDDVYDKDDYLADLVDATNGNMTFNYVGEFSVAGISDVEFKTGEILSKGKYTLWIKDTDKAYESKGEYNVNIASQDATAYANIVLKAKTSIATTPLTVNFTGDASKIDWVVVEKLDGTIVDTESETATVVDKVTFNVAANDVYVVKVYAQGKFVGSQEVTVQDFAKTITVSLNAATRS